MRALVNPTFVMRWSTRAAPWLGGLTLLLVAAGLYLALIASPPDYQQGDSVRIMYVHVPAAWMALFCYTCMAAASAVLSAVTRIVGSAGIAATSAPSGFFAFRLSMSA